MSLQNLLTGSVDVNSDIANVYAFLRVPSASTGLWMGMTYTQPSLAGGQAQSFPTNGSGSIGSAVPLPTDETGYQNSFTMPLIDKAGNIYFVTQTTPGNVWELISVSQAGAVLGSIALPATNSDAWYQAIIFYVAGVPYIAMAANDTAHPLSAARYIYVFDVANPAAMTLANTYTVGTITTDDYNFSGTEIGVDTSGNIYHASYNSTTAKLEVYKITNPGGVSTLIYNPAWAGGLYAILAPIIGTQGGNILLSLGGGEILLLSPTGTVIATASGYYAGADGDNNLLSVEWANINFGLTNPDDSFPVIDNDMHHSTSAVVNTAILSGADLSVKESGTVTVQAAPSDGGLFYFAYFYDTKTLVSVNSDSTQNTWVLSVGKYISGPTPVAFPLDGYQYANGNPVAFGYLLVWLNANGSVNDVQVTTQPTRVNLDDNGEISGSPVFWANGDISPTGTYYFLQVYSSAGQSVAGPLQVTV